MNPKAFEKEPLTIQDVLNARMVSYPFTVRDCCLVTDGGGGLSYCHPGMYGLLVLIEAIRQVRGECGQRQVTNCDIALAHGNGGVLSTQCTVILGSAGAHFAFTDYASLWNSPQPFVEQFMQVAQTLVARGATSLYPAGLYLSQWLIDQGIRDVEGAIIMDPLAIGIKMAELTLDLKRIGIKRYQAGPWAVPPEEVRSMLKSEFG